MAGPETDIYYNFVWPNSTLSKISSYSYTKFPKEFNKTHRYCITHTEKEIARYDKMNSVFLLMPFFTAAITERIASSVHCLRLLTTSETITAGAE